MGNHFKRPSKTDIYIRAPSGEFDPLFPISIFETLSNFTQLQQVTQLIEVVKQKMFSKLGILSPELLKCFIFPLFTVSQSPQF